jgi:glucose/arabinose dehydrogenase
MGVAARICPLVLSLAVVCSVGSCTVGPAADRAQQVYGPGWENPTPPAPSPPESEPSREPKPLPEPAPETGTANVVEVLATGLDGVCCLAALPGGDLLVGVRHTGEVYRVTAAGSVTLVGTLSAVSLGEGAYSLLGLTVAPDDHESIFAYSTQTNESEVDRYILDFAAPEGEAILWSAWTLLPDLPLQADQNVGAALTLGPDGTLYAGEAGGDILRVQTDAGIPDDNPTLASPTYAGGHGDIAVGLTFDEIGRGWSVDSDGVLREVVPGTGAVAPMADVDPPSGFAHVGSSLWVGDADGALWRIPLNGQGGLSGAPERLPIQGSPVALLSAGSNALWALTTQGDILRMAVT